MYFYVITGNMEKGLREKSWNPLDTGEGQLTYTTFVTYDEIQISGAMVHTEQDNCLPGEKSLWMTEEKQTLRDGGKEK